MSRWILSKPEYHDDSPIAVAGKLVLNSTVAIKQTISDHAKKGRQERRPLRQRQAEALGQTRG